MRTSIATICPFCGGKNADAQTGRCLNCGKVAMVPNSKLAEEFGHLVLDRHAGESRPSPSKAYRGNGSAAPKLEDAPAQPAERATRPPGEDLPASPAPADPSDGGAEPTRGSLHPPAGASAFGATGASAPSAEQVAAEASVALRKHFDEQASLAFVLPESRETSSWLAQTHAVRDQLVARAEKAAAQAVELHAEAERLRHTASAFTSLLGQLSIAGSSSPPAALRSGERWSRGGAVQVDACIDCGRSYLPHCANGRCRNCDGKWRTRSKRS